MTPGLSLRSRILLGAGLWTLGLFVLFGLLLTQTMLRGPGTIIYVHRTFLNVGALVALAAATLAGGFSLVRGGLKSFGAITVRLAAIRDGRDRRLDGAFPLEVQPLIGEVNGLLADREQRLSRALATAGDLAHGLKTPLAVLNHVAARAREADQPRLAEDIAQQVDRMRRLVDYHLAQARASATGGRTDARCDVRASADGLVRTMHTVYAGRALDIGLDVEAGAVVRVVREDLDEMLGNLLDNACKWARSRVVLRATTATGSVSVVIDDDGPGLAPELRQTVLRRGVRADEARSRLRPWTGDRARPGGTLRRRPRAHRRTPRRAARRTRAANTARRRLTGHRVPPASAGRRVLPDGRRHDSPAAAVFRRGRGRKRKHSRRSSPGANGRRSHHSSTPPPATAPRVQDGLLP